MFRKPRILAAFRRLFQESVPLSNTEARAIFGNLNGCRWINLCVFEFQGAVKNNPVLGADLHGLLDKTGCLNKLASKQRYHEPLDPTETFYSRSE